MKNLHYRTLLTVMAAIWITATIAGETSAGTGAVKVEIRNEDSHFRLYRGGLPYYIKGAVYWTDPIGTFPLKDLVARGGNSIRTGIEFRHCSSGRLGMSSRWAALRRACG